jgi:adenine-specific DNA-methyltransferase
MPWPPTTETELATTCAALAAGEPGPPGLRESIHAGDDPLGEAFCRLRTPTQRRDAGAFYTPRPVVDAMVRWVLAQRPARVVDCGCGSGRFAVALRRAGFAGPIVAVDLDPMAIGMTRAHLAAAGLAPVQLRCEDFTRLSLAPLAGATAWLGNPPYLRHHQLSASTKAHARQMADAMGLEISGLAGLHVLFLLAVARNSRPGDLGCFVTSSEWLDVGYGALARTLLAGPLGLRFLALLRPESVVFDDAQSTAAIFGWRAGHDDAPRLRLLSGLQALGGLERGRGTPRALLARQARWSALLGPSRAPERGEGLLPLGRLVSVHRGVATGHNGFFVLERGQGRDLGLQPWLQPCLHRARQVQRAEGLVRAQDCSHGLLLAPERPPAGSDLEAYLRRGAEQGVSERYLCRKRRAWWRLPRPPAAPIVATYMARRPPSFALNPDGCALLNVVHGLHPREPMSGPLLEALVRWLNEHAAELTGHRSYHGGLRKWEPSELEAVMVPAPERLFVQG